MTVLGGPLDGMGAGIDGAFSGDEFYALVGRWCVTGGGLNGMSEQDVALWTSAPVDQWAWWYLREPDGRWRCQGAFRNGRAA